MDGGLTCQQCGTPSAGRRFCTTCGMPVTAVRQESGLGDSPPAPSTTNMNTNVAPVLMPTPPMAELHAGAVPAAPTQGPAWSPGSGPVSPPWTGRASLAPTHGRPAARYSWRSLLALVVLGALVLSCWALTNGGERHILSGTVQLSDSSMSNLNSGDQCTGSGGYADIAAGAGVVLTDGSGTTMATAELSDGTFDGAGCVFSFVLRQVHHASFYRLAVAGSNRGELQYSYADLAHGDWSVQLSVGDT